MKSNPRDLFTFSSAERKGVIFLVILLILAGCFNLVVVLRHPPGANAGSMDWMQDTALEIRPMPVAGGMRMSTPTRVGITGRPFRQGGPVNISHADSAGLEKLPGIGPVLAVRIIRYRKLLGGFYSPRQIKEVYGISDSLYMRIGSRLTADTIGIRKIHVNTAGEREMARHPYIGKYAARAILRYRDQVKVIKDIRELETNGLIPGDVFEKARNYLAL